MVWSPGGQFYSCTIFLAGASYNQFRITIIMAANLQHASQDWVEFNAWPQRDYAQHREALIQSFEQVRLSTIKLTTGLNAEDMNLQSMPEASPPKWHLAHTSWFFETFLLTEHILGYQSPNPHYAYLFNSYYHGVGQQYSRAHRGLLSRPSIDEVLAYRQHIDINMLEWLKRLGKRQFAKLAPLVVLGLNHEQQHQELLLTDIQHGFSYSPLAPQMAPVVQRHNDPGELVWLNFPGGIVTVGQPCNHDQQGFAFDNESPEHQQLLQPYQLANRPVTNSEYLAFIEADGYQQPQYWHSDGWAWLQANNINRPLYWRYKDNQWKQHSLAGELELDPHAPLSQINWYEASAYASWKGCRLPTEAEWEHAANHFQIADGQFADSGEWQPKLDATADKTLYGMFGTVWEWTASSYSPYPGFCQPAGAIGEYNGKFMANQYVLRGGSCATPAGHIRSTYRNFFYPQDRWQFSGLRLAHDSHSG